MATYEGSNGQVKVSSAGGTTIAVAEVRSWSIDVSREAVESTAMGDANRTYKKGLQSYTGSMDIVYDDTSGAEVTAALDPANDDAVVIEFYADAAGTAAFSGTVITTGYSLSASYDGLIEASVSFQGTGALTAGVYGQ